MASNVTLFARGAMIFLPKFDPEAIVKLMARATVLMGVPTSIRGCCRHLTRIIRCFQRFPIPRGRGLVWRRARLRESIWRSGIPVARFAIAQVIGTPMGCDSLLYRFVAERISMKRALLRHRNTRRMNKQRRNRSINRLPASYSFY